MPNYVKPATINNTPTAEHPITYWEALLVGKKLVAAPDKVPDNDTVRHNSRLAEAITR